MLNVTEVAFEFFFCTGPSITLIRVISPVSVQNPLEKFAPCPRTVSCVEFVIEVLYLLNTYFETRGGNEIPMIPGKDQSQELPSR